MADSAELAKVVIGANPNYNLQTMGTLHNALSGLSEKACESYLKRTRAMVKTINFAPYENWFLSIGEELAQIGRIVSDSILTICPNGAPRQHVDAVVFELAGYQIKSIKKVCDYAVRSYDESKTLPPLSFWLRCITAVKGEKASKNSTPNPVKSQISDKERAEVKDMMRGMCEKLGVDYKKEGRYTNSTTLIRHYGIMQNLNKGLVQVQTLDKKDYEWVQEYEVGERKPIDHSRTLELFVSGRITEKEAQKAYDKSLEVTDEQ